MCRTKRACVRLGLVAAALLAAGCHDSDPSRARPSAAGVPATALESFIVEPVPAPLERQLDGTIEAVNQGTVAAQTAGRVAEIFYDVNDFVPAGAVIVRLRATEQRAGLLQAEAALREATARESEAEVRHQRISAMYERKVVAKAMLDQVTAERDTAVARLAAAQAALESAREGVAYTEIRAPYAGIVTKRHVQVGETVAPGSLIMSGISLQFLRVAVDMPQSVVERVRTIKKAAVYLEGRRIEATQLTVFPQASTPSNTFRARLALPENAADLYPGMFVKVGFVVGEAQRLLVPARAVVERSEVTGVYVLDEDGRASLRHIRTGHRFDDSIEVLAGLGAGECVALDPVAAMKQLKPAASARP